MLWNTEYCVTSRTPAGSGQQSVCIDASRRLAAGWHPLACGWRLLAGFSPSVAGGAAALMEEMVQHLLTRTVVSWNTVISTCVIILWDLVPLRPLFETKKQIQIINDKEFAH